MAGPTSKVRRSTREKKTREFFCSTRIEGRETVSEIVIQCGQNQPGRTYVKDPQMTEENAKGKDVYKEYLVPAGWEHKANSAKSGKHMESEWVFFKKPFKDSEFGVTRFYEHHQIWQKWKSDADFRQLYLGNQHNTIANVEIGAPSSTPTAAAENQTGNYNRLGQPTPGVPVAVSAPAESAQGATETIGGQASGTTPNGGAKRGRPTAGGSKKKKRKGNKRPKKKGSPISIPRTTLKDPPVVTPTSSRDLDTSDHQTTMASNLQEDMALRLGEDKDTIIELKKQLEESQNIAEGHASRLAESTDTIRELRKQLQESQNLVRAREIEIEDLRDLNNKLREAKSIERASVLNLREERDKLKEESEQMQEELEQMRMNHAMDQGFQGAE